MKILFDTNTPAPLAGFLRGHAVVRTGDLGWQSLENGIHWPTIRPVAARVATKIDFAQNGQVLWIEIASL